MTLAWAGTRPLKCLLINTASGQVVEPLFNPTKLGEAVQVRYARHQVAGLTHEVLQYQGTSNRRLSGVEFYLDRFFAEQQPEKPEILQFRSFMRALTVPPAGVFPAAPPRLLFMWPGVLTIEAVVVDLAFDYRQFNAHAEVVVFTATCTLEAFEVERLTSERFAEELG